MFGRHKPVIFDPYGRRRSRWRMPSWMVWLLTGTIAGVGGVVYLQERHLPPRLSQGDSAALRNAYDKAESERQRLQAELTATQQQLQVAQAAKKALDTELASSRSATQDLRADVATLVEALPPDPRDNGVEVRAGRFNASGNTLAYDVVLTRSRAGAKPMSGVVQFVVAGESTRGGPNTVSPKAIPVSIGSHEIVRGSVTLPEGFTPRQTTVQVLDREAGRSLGMRVMLVK